MQASPEVAAGTATSAPLPADGAVDGVALDPSRYADGACRQYPPTGGDRHSTVFLDPGHGGPDEGGEGTTSAGAAVDERSLALAVATQTASRLRADGYAVVLSRTTASAVLPLTPSDTTPAGRFTEDAHRADLAARAGCATLAGADAQVSVHFNSGDSPRYAGALTTFDAVRPFAADNERLATLVQAGLVSALAEHGVRDRGITPDTQVGNSVGQAGDDYGHLVVLGPPKAGYLDTPSMMPGALVEPLFLSNPAEATLAASAQGQRQMAVAIATAVGAFLGR